ncbi:MAG: hypothetical protein R3261_08355 [Alphaproteobacteria bacterium]|nr:hypothetical protein [Alphaproteobacteria bacterium]
MWEIQKLLQDFGTPELLMLMGTVVFVSLLLKMNNSWIKKFRKTRKNQEAEISYKDPDNLPDWRKTVWRARLQAIFALIAILGFTFIAIMHSF